MAPERSRPERSRSESFLPARSAGLTDVAEAMAASTSARVISADAISGDVRSTCCIMPCEHRQFCERASPMLDYFIATMACAENDVLNVFGCGRLIAGIGFLRLPASSTSGVTGVLTYVRKPGGA